mgnify:CR=1 FL=1
MALIRIYGCIVVFYQHVPQEGMVMTAEMNVETAIKSMHVTMLVVFVPIVAKKDSKDNSVKHVRLLCFKVLYISDF